MNSGTVLKVCSQSSLACRVASSARLRSVMSRTIFEAPDDPAVLALDRGDGHGHVDPAPVLGHPHRLQVLHALAAQHTLQNLLFLLNPLRRQQQRDWLADDLLRPVAEQPLGPCVPGLDDAVEVLGQDGIVGRLNDRRQSRQRLSVCFCSVKSRNTSTTPCTAPSLWRIGAPLSSMGVSRPSLAMRIVWLASPMTVPRRRTFPTGFSTGWRVCSLMMWNTSASGWPSASPLVQPVRRSASPLRKVTRPWASVTITPSPMLASVTASSCRCRSMTAAERLTPRRRDRAMWRRRR